jgi:hypothetical protein
MKNSRISGFAFVALAIAFLAIGISTQRAFIGIAVAFLVIGIIFIVRSKAASGNKQ